MFLRALTRTGKWLLYLFAGLLVLIALLTAFARFAVFNKADYSDRVEPLVSRFVGSPVKIDQIDLVWDRFDAVANLSDVRILSADGTRTDLTLPSLELELNVRDMLLSRNLSLRRVQLKELSLVVDYKGHGELEILGREINSGVAASVRSNGATGVNNKSSDLELQSRGRSALSWLFNAERIAILDSSITLVDRTRDATHRIDDVDIRAFNQGDLHQLRINTRLPGAIGKTSAASFDFTGTADNIRQWNGQFYIDAGQLNLSGLSDMLQTDGMQIDGLADLQVWGRWRGTRVNELRVLGDIENLSVKHADSLTGAVPLNADKAEVDVDWLRDTEGGWLATFNRLAMRFPQAPKVKPTSVKPTSNQQTKQSPTQQPQLQQELQPEELVLDGISLSQVRDKFGVSKYRAAGPELDILRLQPLVQFAAAATGQTRLSEQLTHGSVRDWLLAGELIGGRVELNTAKAEIYGVNLKTAAVELQNLTASLLFKDGVGFFDIAPPSMVGGAELFSKSMQPLNLSGSIRFTNNGQRWLFGTDDLAISNDDIKTVTRVNLRHNRMGQRFIDSVTSVDYINLANVKAYLPNRGLKPRLRKWLSEAIINGSAVRGQITVSGDLSDFAPSQGRGELFGEIDIVDSTVKFRPDWPVAKQMDGNLTFNARSMRGRIYQGAIREARFNDARLFIADFKNPLLEVQTDGLGPLDDMLEFLQRGPLALKVGRFLGNARGSGASRLALDLLIPLKRELRDQLKVDGSVLLENASVNAPGFGINLESVTGELRFNRRGVLLDNLLVRYLGIPMKVNATQKTIGGKLVNSVSVKGPVAVASLLNSYQIPVSDVFEGTSDWQLVLDITRRKPGAPAKVELTATSDLSGTAILLPVPLNKAPENILSARVYRNFSTADKDWWIDVPGLAQIKMRVGKNRKLESMAVALGRSNNTVLPWRGIALHGDVGRIDTMGWYDFSRSLRSKLPATGARPFALFAKVAARKMLIGKNSIGNGVYTAFEDGQEQVHRIESPLVNGELRTLLGGGGDQPLVLRLDNLDKKLLVALGARQGPDNVTNRPFEPRDLPPIDAIVKELKWDNWRLSRVALRTAPTDSGLAITSLTARQEAMRVSGSGQWTSGANGHYTTLDLNSSVDDLGASVRALGGGGSFASGKGEAALSLSWPGPAYRPDLKSLAGELFLSFRDGRILGVEPGAGRILGLFALQALPRRLTLDFRDIVKSGLEYSTINGNFSIGDGKLSSQTLLFTGPAAEILIHGHSDFSNRSYDQKVDLLPRVSGALPLIGVLSGGPAAGVTALVADGILKGLGVNLDEIGRRRYVLNGSWDNPQWTTMNPQ